MIKSVFFLHENSVNCKFGMVCERILCTFKHEEVPEENVRDEIVIHDESAGDEIVNQDESLMDIIMNGAEIIDVEENEEFMEKENETIERTFSNPS